MDYGLPQGPSAAKLRDRSHGDALPGEPAGGEGRRARPAPSLATPAVANAVMDALSSRSAITHLDLPLTGRRSGRRCSPLAPRLSRREVSDMYPAPFEYHRAGKRRRGGGAPAAATPRRASSSPAGTAASVMKLRFASPGTWWTFAASRVVGRARGGRCADHRRDDAPPAWSRLSAVVRERRRSCRRPRAQIGDAQVRNMGTIGGSLAHADPAADLPAVTLALGVEASRGGSPRRADHSDRSVLHGDVLVGARAPMNCSSKYAFLSPRREPAVRTRSTPIPRPATRSLVSRRS